MGSHWKSALPAAVALLFIGGAPYAHSQQVLKPAAKWQIDGMAAALKDPLPDVRTAALAEIQLNPNTGWGTALEPLIVPLLRDPDPYTRRSAVSVLGAMKATDQKATLVSLIKDKTQDPILRSAAVSALATMQLKDQEEELASLLKDKRESRYVRGAAASALGVLQAKDQEAELVSVLKDRNEDSNIRANAVSALGALHARDQQAELISILKDGNEDSMLRPLAASALGTMQAREEEDELVKFFKDKAQDTFVRSMAILALGTMQARDKEAELISLGKDRTENSNLRDAAFFALHDLKATGQEAELVSLIKDRTQDPYVRNAAALALRDLKATGQEAVLVSLIKDKTQDPFVRSAVVAALGHLQAKDQEAELISLLKNTTEDPGVRNSAILALTELQARDHQAYLVTLLKDPRFQQNAAQALVPLGPLEAATLPLVASAFYFNHADQGKIRFQCHYLLGAAPAAELVLKRVMLPSGEGKLQPVPISSKDEARQTLQAFHEVLPPNPDDTRFSAEAEGQILQIARNPKFSWSSPEDRQLISSLSRQMSPNNAAALRGVIETPLWETILQKLWKVIVVQLVLWILLLFFYPRSTEVQAFFFWNRWARKFFGLGYVDFCLTWIPFLRNRLLAPFRTELIADARISDENPDAYFDDVQVRHGENTSPISKAIPEVVAQSVLEGESGLGKSIFLRRLVNSSTRTVAYLPAENCDRGVFELIQSKLQGKAGDETFLRSIIWSGGLSIVIDGLNEVSVETREKIRRFLDDFPKANVLLATQPMLWKRPPKAKVFRLLPLTDDRIQTFLESRFPTFTPTVAMTESDYKDRCREYLETVLGKAQSEEDRSAARLVLSNPMDLTTAAQILVGGETPTLKNLQEQQFARADRDFRDTHPGQQFPLRQFSESVYERLLSDEITLDSSQFFEPIQALLAHKMALKQNDVDADGKPVRKWVFRHDKIRDFFLVQAFENQRDERILQHMDDPRFRGVYLMLASQLPLVEANELRNALVDRAAETKDHHLSDAVVEVLKSRRATGTKPAPPITAGASSV